jgi:hypothetical protein
MLNKQSKDYEILTKEVAKCGFDLENCDGILSVIKTKGNSNGFVGIKYDSETKTYRQAEKISKTEADKIFKTISKKQSFFEIDDWEDIKDDEEIPFN